MYAKHKRVDNINVCIERTAFAVFVCFVDMPASHYVR